MGWFRSGGGDGWGRKEGGAGCEWEWGSGKQAGGGDGRVSRETTFEGEDSQKQNDFAGLVGLSCDAVSRAKAKRLGS
jgi:hypothetical protein